MCRHTSTAYHCCLCRYEKFMKLLKFTHRDIKTSFDRGILTSNQFDPEHSLFRFLFGKFSQEQRLYDFIVK